MSDRHAILAPSKAARWAGQCPGSVVLESQQPAQDKTPDQLDGDAAHWMAATRLAALKAGAARAVDAGVIAPNGVVITDEMVEAVDLFVTDVIERVGVHLDKIHVEEWTDINSVHPDNGGTPDLWVSIVLPGKSVLIIWDFKFGHRFVDAFENWQTVDYAFGLLEHPEVADSPDIEIRIIQPRNFHMLGPVRQWSVTVDDLTSMFQRLRASAAEARSNNPRTHVGPECTDCTARHACPTLQIAADTATDISGSIVSLELPPGALGTELRIYERALDLLKARVTGLQEQATGYIKQGKSVPGYELQQGFGREAWTKTPTEIFVLGDMMGVDLRKPPQPVTPKQARDAKLDPALVAGYSQRPAGAVKLTPVNTTLARKVFGKS